MGRMIENRLVPDPSMTDSEYLHQQAKERERAQAAGSKPDLNIGKVWAAENAMTRIGALCYIRRREPHHERAAEEFKSLYEARYGSGTPAMDPGRIQVDRTIMAHDSGMAAKLDYTWRLKQAEDRLGKPVFDRLVAVLVLCIPVSDGLSSRPAQREVAAFLADLDALASLWGYRKRAA